MWGRMMVEGELQMVDGLGDGRAVQATSCELFYVR